MTQNLSFYKNPICIKNAEFDAEFESVEKVAKNFYEKDINEKVTGKCSF